MPDSTPPRRTLASIAPELMGELLASLAEQGRTDLAQQLASAEIRQCNFDESVDAGYIYLVRPRPSRHYEKLSAPVKETISCDLQGGLNIDVDHDGNVFGIEFLGRPDVVARLQAGGAL
jgi:uncharacterized protein YuzE